MKMQKLADLTGPKHRGIFLLEQKVVFVGPSGLSGGLTFDLAQQSQAFLLADIQRVAVGDDIAITVTQRGKDILKFVDDENRPDHWVIESSIHQERQAFQKTLYSREHALFLAAPHMQKLLLMAEDGSELFLAFSDDPRDRPATMHLRVGGDRDALRDPATPWLDLQAAASHAREQDREHRRHCREIGAAPTWLAVSEAADSSMERPLMA